MTLDACTSDFDDVIATYSGATLNALTAGPSVDDACNDLGAKVSLQVRAGITTWISISGVEDAAGTFTLVAHPETLPSNDAFVDAVRIRPGRIQGTNVLASRELGEPSIEGSGGGSVWYRYRTNTRQRVTLDTTNSSFDTLLGVYTGDLGSLRKIATNDDGGAGDTSQLSFTAVPRRTYWIVVDGYENARGSFELGLSDGGIAGVGVTLGTPESTDLSTVVDRGLRTSVGLPPVLPPGAAGPRVGAHGAPHRPAAQRGSRARPHDGPPRRRRPRRRRGAAPVARGAEGAPGRDVAHREPARELQGTRSSNRYVTRTVTLSETT